MLTNKLKQLIRALQQKKFRKEHQLFVVEGKKMVKELLNSSYEIEYLFSTHPLEYAKEINLISEKELESVSSLKEPNGCLAVVRIPINVSFSGKGIRLYLDAIQDPGNLGTIIRTADWFGIQEIICSPNCVDLYNPKVIQSTMGSIFRIKINYLEPVTFFSKNTAPVYGAVLGGNNLYDQKFSKDIVIVIGNESRGISEEILKYIDYPISIPGKGEAESLNAAIATGIICAEVNRHHMQQ